MLDRAGITRRFLSCYPDLDAEELAGLFAVTAPTVFQWLSGVREVPWSRLKQLVDSQNISWDWLIEGRGAKKRRSKRRTPVPLDRGAINQRFFSLFPDSSQAEIGNQLGVRHASVSRWRNGVKPVPWEKLHWAVVHKKTAWEWLLEGR